LVGIRRTGCPLNQDPPEDRRNKQAFESGSEISCLEESFGFPFVLVRAADGLGRGLALLGLAAFRRRKGVRAARDEPRCAHELKKKYLKY
jgi:hypothetical protein